MKDQLIEGFLPFYEKSKKENVNEKDNFYILSEALCHYYIDLWNSCPSDISESIYHIFSWKVKKENYAEIDKFLKEFTKLCFQLDKDKENKDLAVSLKTTTLNYINNSIFFQTKISKDYPREFIKNTSCFVNQAKNFDENFNFFDIFQALRNVWTMNLLQEIFEVDVDITPAVFGYSMLYPYTDNLLDSKNIAQEEKQYISKRLKERLSGKQLLPLTTYEEKVYRLITLIEDYYPYRDHYSLYRSLNYIHYFQTNSLLQQSGDMNRDADEINEISFKKGGMSVLADAYLVKGNLDMYEIIFSFGLGIVLQLLDDLQDISMDLKSKNGTIFTRSLSHDYLDNVTLRMLNFINLIVSSITNFDCLLGRNIKKALMENCTLMVLFSISRNKAFYSSGFTKSIRQFYPFPAVSMKSFNRRMQHTYYRLKKLKNLRSEDIFNILI